MSIAEPPVKVWTAADLVARFGAIPLNRIRHDPPPGLATEQDAIEIHDREKRLYELIDGVLVEKTVGLFESYLATELSRLLGNFVHERDLGVVLGADALMRLFPGRIRVPDCAFISWDRWPVGRAQGQPLADFSPDLAIEVISPSNTRKEMQDKLHDYFRSGVRLVWYVYPIPREVRVYTSPDSYAVRIEKDGLDGGDIVPGFVLDLRSFFAEPRPASDSTVDEE